MRYVCDRKIPRTESVVSFEVEALNEFEAKHIAEELAYAVAWHKHRFRGEVPPRKFPENDRFFMWAYAHTDENGAK